MAVPLRADSEFGLTPAQIAAMPARLRSRISDLNPDDDADEIARLEADIKVWEQAAEQVKGKDGKWSIVWTKLRESENILREYGARNSKSDMARIQAAHDALVDLGAVCSHNDATAPVAEGAVDIIIEADRKPERITFREAGSYGELVTLAEADAEWDDDKRELWITPIRPGPGNSRDNFFYPKHVLREAVEAGRFNERKVFANHPRKTEQRELPERDVRDWVAVVKETVWNDLKDRPRSRVKVLDQATYERWKTAPEHVAFSVLGEGQARPGKVDGQSKRIVESVARVKSIDWVTEAGAGGGIDFAESAYEELEMSLQNLTIEQLREARPDLVAALREADDEDTDAETTATDDDGDDEDVETTPGDDEAEQVQTQGGTSTHEPDSDAEPAGKPAPDGYVTREEFEALRRKLVEQEMKEAVADAKRKARSVVDTALRESTLPRVAREYVIERFSEASVGEGMAFRDETALKGAVAAEVRSLAKITDSLTGRSAVSGLGAPARDDSPTSLREAKEESLLKRLGASSAPPANGNGETGTPADAVLTEGSATIADRIARRF